MLIDTMHIDQLRVNFTSHFSTQNNPTEASNQIRNIVNNYPETMTNEIRQWLNDHEIHRITAPLATVDTSKSVDSFDDYVKELEESINLYKTHDHNDSKFKVCAWCTIKLFCNSFCYCLENCSIN